MSDDATRPAPDPEMLVEALAVGDITDEQIETLCGLLGENTPASRDLAQRVRTTLMIRGWVRAKSDTRFVKETSELIARLRQDSGRGFVVNTMQRVRDAVHSGRRPVTVKQPGRQPRRTPAGQRPAQRRSQIGSYILVALASAACVVLAFHAGLIQAPRQESPAAKSEPEATITPQSPVVEIVNATDARRVSGTQPLRPGDRLGMGETIVTGPGGSATLRYADGTSITLQTKSELALLQGQAPAGTAELSKGLELRSGELSANVMPQRAGCPAVILTPQSHVEVLGTRFALNVTDTRTRLQTQEGIVKFSRRDGSDGREVTAEHVALAMAKQAVAVRPTRVRDGLVALYEFREGNGDRVQDASGVEPRADLVRNKDGQIEWTANGLVLKREHSIGVGTVLFGKHNDSLRKAEQFTVEIWYYMPANTPDQQRNAHLAHIGLTATGAAIFSRAVPQLRHTVDTWDAGKGSVSYDDSALVSAPKNGEVSAAMRQEFAKMLREQFKNPDAAFELCGYLAGDDPRQPKAARPLTYRLVAIYDRILSAEEVRRNFEAGPTPWE
jgi:hypothetical protein